MKRLIMSPLVRFLAGEGLSQQYILQDSIQSNFKFLNSITTLSRLLRAE